MKRSLLLLGSLFAFFGVALGAFGAHGLKSYLAPDMLAIFETAVRYQMYHVFGIFIAAVLADSIPAAGTAGRLFGAGIVLFSGSLMVLSLTGIRTFGLVTPFGGLCFLAGWSLLGYGVFKMKKES